MLALSVWTFGTLERCPRNSLEPARGTQGIGGQSSRLGRKRVYFSSMRSRPLTSGCWRDGNGLAAGDFRSGETSASTFVTNSTISDGSDATDEMLSF